MALFRLATGYVLDCSELMEIHIIYIYNGNQCVNPPHKTRSKVAFWESKRQIKLLFTLKILLLSCNLH